MTLFQVAVVFCLTEAADFLIQRVDFVEISSVTEATLLLILSPRALASGVFAMLLNKLFILFHLICFTLVFENSCTQINQCCIFNVSYFFLNIG